MDQKVNLNSVIDLNQVQSIVSYLEFCTNAYVFVFDVEHDEFAISREAITQFNLPGPRFTDALNHLVQITAPQDKTALVRSIEKIISDETYNGMLACHFIDRTGAVRQYRIREKMRSLEGVQSKVLIGCLEDMAGSVVDEQSGLPLWKSAAENFEKQAAVDSSLSGFLLEIEIDDFASLVERNGAESGSKMIRIVSDICRRTVTGMTQAYSLGGHRFLMMNIAGGTGKNIDTLFSAIKREIQNVEHDLKYELLFTVSAGGIAFINYHEALSTLFQKLSFSLAAAQEHGHNNLYLFNAAEYTAHLNKIDLQEKLRAAIQDNFRGFVLFYQPVVDAKKLIEQNASPESCILGAEALLRWQSPDGNMIGATEIIPLLEESELIIPVGRWIMLQAFSQCAQWQHVLPSFHMSMNLSSVQLNKSSIVDDVQLALARTAVDPQNITLEITESGMMDSKAMQQIVDELAALGVKIDIDDFGTGYSNLRYIQNLHANTLKLDYTFIHQAVHGSGSEQKIIEYVTKMAHDLGMAVCMEGIESVNDLDKLRDMMPDKFQGFLFGRPVNARTFEQDNLNTSKK